MNITLAQENMTFERGISRNRSKRHIIASISTLTALAVFEFFNYSTTAFALRSLFGNLFIGEMNWISLIALAVCCLDIAGILCLFLPSDGTARSRRDHRLFGAWLLAAGLNTWLTWRGISLAIAVRQAQIGWVVDGEVLTSILPGFIAFLIWLIRVLIIGALPRSKSPITEPDFSLAETPGLNKGAGAQAAFPLSMPFHDALPTFEQLVQSARIDTIKREPTYRGIPVRYKTY